MKQKKKHTYFSIDWVIFPSEIQTEPNKQRVQNCYNNNSHSHSFQNRFMKRFFSKNMMIVDKREAEYKGEKIKEVVISGKDDKYLQ